MKLWLVCFLMLFWAVEATQGISQAPLALTPLPLPWVLMGGVALAIAANYRPALAASAKPTHLPALDASKSTAQAPKGSPMEPPNVADPSLPASAPLVAKQPSISFEIHKPPFRPSNRRPIL